MSLNHVLPKKISLVPKKHHGFLFILFLLGCVLPPLAVALRFGIGTDFFINVILCICGYFPCHFHNFYIQNIRNNSNKARTPKWAKKAGFLDTTEEDRRARKNQWSKRFDERNERSTHLGQALEEGEEGEDYAPISAQDREAEQRRRNEGLWTGEDEAYYNEDPNRAPNQERWHYPANFEGAAVGDGRAKRNGGAKPNMNGDRWERSRASRTNSSSSTSTYPPVGATDNDVPEWGREYGSKQRNTKSKKQNGMAAPGGAAGKGGWANNGGFINDTEQHNAWDNTNGGARANGNARTNGNAPPSGNARTNGNAPQKQGARQQSGGGDIFEHEF